MPTKDEIIKGCFSRMEIEMKKMASAFNDDEDSLEEKVKKIVVNDKKEEAMNNGE